MRANNDRNCPSRAPFGRFGQAALLGTALLLAPAARAQSQGSVNTIAGTGEAGYADGSPGYSQFKNPTALALRGDGQLFIADTDNNAVRALQLSDNKVSTFALVDRPVGLVFNSKTNLLVARETDGAILEFDRYQNIRQTLRPSLTAGPITALAIDRADNLYIAERDGLVIRVNAQGFTDAAYRPPVGGIHEFRGVVVTDDGILYVSDAAAHVIWKFSGGNSQVFAGVLNQSGNTQGAIGLGRLNRPHQISAGPNGSVVIADRGNHQVRVASCEGEISVLYGINPANWVVLPDFGSGITQNWPGWYDGPIQYVEVRDPVGLVVDAVGTVFDSEDYYQLIRKGTGLVYPVGCNSTTTPTSTNTPPTLVLEPSSGFFPNGVTVTISAANSVSGFSRDVTLYYTLDGNAPARTDREIPIDADGRARLTLPGPVDLALLRVRAFLGGKTGGPVAAATPTVVPTPILTPDSGYYPMGVDVVITSTNGFPAGTVLYYETDGSAPTTNSVGFIVPDAQRAILSWRDSTRDLRSLKVKAFVGPNEGVAVSGKAVSFAAPGTRGEVGIPLGRKEFRAGIGSYYILPIVANLSDDQTLDSLQFAVEISPLPGSPVLQTRDIEILPVSDNDFIQVSAASSGGPDTVFSRARDGIIQMGISYNAGGKFQITRGYATIALLGIQFEAEDSLGNVAQIDGGYTIAVTTVSGTGESQRMALTSMPARTIRFGNIPFREGDTFPAYWYNAGDFGDDLLESGDVGNAVFAGLGFHRPFTLSDAFAAMDVYRLGVWGNVIEYNDPAIILRRALGFESPNVFRVRNDAGEWQSNKTPPQNLARNSVRALANSETPAWRRDVTFIGEIVDRVQPIQAVAVPVYMQAGAGAAVSGMQFVAELVPVDGAPEISEVTFEPARGLPEPEYFGNSVNGLGTLKGTVFARWDNLAPALTGKVLLGNIRFTTPASLKGHYNVNFRETGGAAIDDNTGELTAYLFQSVHGEVWPWIAHPEGVRVSDDWAAHFFGAASGSVDPQEDTDGDGFSNVEEYLAGTDPNRSDWQVRVQNDHVTFRWVGRTGRQYTVEKTDNFKSWNAVTGKIEGQDGFLEYNELTTPGRAQFYRLNVQ